MNITHNVLDSGTLKDFSYSLKLILSLFTALTVFGHSFRCICFHQFQPLSHDHVPILRFQPINFLN